MITKVAYLVLGTILIQLLDLSFIIAIPDSKQKLLNFGKFHVEMPVPKNQNISKNEVTKRTRKFTRIVGGKEVQEHKYSSIVAMNIYGSQMCGATILDEEWVLSAAHCVITYNAKYFEFVAGKLNIEKVEDTEQTRTAEEAIPHEDFDTNTLQNDIALFKVSPKFEFDKFVQPANLPKEKWKIFSGMAIATGWGLIKQNGPGSPKLQEVELPLMTVDACRNKYSKDQVYDSNICAGYDEGGKDACQGDSGGPIYFNDNGRLYQIGVTSWGIGCAKANSPGVYTDVSQYLDWIRNTQAKYKTPAGRQRQLKPSSKKESGETKSDTSSVKEGSPKKAIIPTVLAEVVCKQYEEYSKLKSVPKPIQYKPKSSVKCGRFKWTDCKAKPCGPFKFYRCA